MPSHDITPSYAGISDGVGYLDFLADHGIIVHPTVLLSIVDHCNRTGAQKRRKRVVGTLLGEIIDNRVHVTASVAVPFEDDADDSIIFFDKDYHKDIYRMFRKVNAKDRIVGWYSTGDRIMVADGIIHAMYRETCNHPVYMMVNLKAEEPMGPATAYISREEPAANKELRATFTNIPLEIGAYEAEEIGVEHLMRDVTSTSVSALGKQVKSLIDGVKCLLEKSVEIQEYLADVRKGKLPFTHSMIYYLQNLLNRMPKILNNSLHADLDVENCESYVKIYVATLVMTTIQLHELIDNRWIIKCGNGKKENNPANEPTTEKK